MPPFPAETEGDTPEQKTWEKEKILIQTKSVFPAITKDLQSWKLLFPLFFPVCSAHFLQTLEHWQFHKTATTVQFR